MLWKLKHSNLKLSQNINVRGFLLDSKIDIRWGCQIFYMLVITLHGTGCFIIIFKVILI